MDRIDTSGQGALVSRPKAGASLPVSPAEKVRPAAGGADRAVESTVSSSKLAGTEPPIDQKRVSELRRAIEEGRYPVVPARIADAMIAGGYTLRAE